MGIVTMIRLTRNMPKRLTDATLYSKPTYCEDAVKQQKKTITVPEAEYLKMMQRMAELECQVIALSAKPATMPPEKEEMLNSALSRVNGLEQELASTKKVLLPPPCLIEKH